MALVLTSHNLATGAVFSSAVSNIGGNWRVTVTTSGCPATQIVDVELWVRGEIGNYSPQRN